MVLITIVNGAYKPMYNWGAHIVAMSSHLEVCQSEEPRYHHAKKRGTINRQP